MPPDVHHKEFCSPNQSYPDELPRHGTTFEIGGASLDFGERSEPNYAQVSKGQSKTMRRQNVR